VFEFLKTLREAMKTKRVQLFECRMGHFLSMVIAGAT
jgi:hypothetical protein